MKKFLSFLRGLAIFLGLIAALALWAAAPWPVLLALAALIALWMLLTRSGKQAASVAGVGISTLSQRLGSSSVVVIGIAGVVAVLVAMLSMAEGYQQTLRRTGSEDSVIVLRGASAAEVMSTLDLASINVIEQAPGIARSADGRPLASPETVVAANLPIMGGAPDEDGSVQLRGVGDRAWQVRKQVKIVEGRKFETGKREVVVGSGARRQFRGMQVGKQIRLGSEMWTVVGIFKSGDAMDSELWADAEMVASTYRRGASRNSVVAQLTDAKQFKQFKAALAGDPRLQVDTTTTSEYFAKQSETMTTVIRTIGIIVGSIMAIGAVFGALNTMFATVATRAREIATLRAIGFRGFPVVVAVMLETMLLAMLGGLIGGALAWAIFNGYTASTIAGGVGQLTFDFRVTGELLWSGLKWALAIGFIGGLFPALRAATLPVTSALRDS
ncbi:MULTISPECIES: ABC transporter permease [Lysobacter]|jgi:putative ABC transport system permease protein|uniref:ABC transporter permease n=1 Tax=Lysobacter gummosus TaxID=262324 RepID=A0ABY3X8B8_9GAMM|nr:MULTISPECIES: ABC transporter permease [Lysobacter]ALN93355.1 ftsX-like permease family protein [Lysobacter gummosus]UJB19925.1 ABC transporter permease [Lysobacter capsici]UJQ26349.1 ABC transporter permease [Lysobacter gummosus]UNP28832.1 ABC transporter permease [Lysobacter gummosus]